MGAGRERTLARRGKLDGERRDAAAEFAGRFLFERRLWAAGHPRVAGVDEVGRGPLAGPVVAAAVVLPREAFLPGLDDSKRLTAARREELAVAIRAQATAWCVAEVDVETIDEINIAQASFLAMRRALAGLGVGIDHVLVDGFRIPAYEGDQSAIVGGDHLSNSIAAASVLAKVHRDARMVAWDAVWPGYGFAAHKGYGTAAHVAALGRLGPCPLHRRSFSWSPRPVQLDLAPAVAAADGADAGEAAGAGTGRAAAGEGIAAELAAARAAARLEETVEVGGAEGDAPAAAVLGAAPRAAEAAWAQAAAGGTEETAGAEGAPAAEAALGAAEPTEGAQ